MTLCSKWKIGRILGSGGMGVVYEASHRNGLKVAVKFPHGDKIQDPASRRRFLREARLSNRLRHPAVPTYYDDDCDEHGNPFLVMELLDGETCEARLRRKGAIPPLQALRIADVVLSVLDAAHRKGILHRDIKPENVFLMRDGRVKLLDFGLARADRSGATSVDIAPTDFAVGTPLYMAPEQLRGDLAAVSEQTDLWAVGALLYTMLTNRWEKDLKPEQFLHGRRNLEPLHKHMPRAPLSLQTLVATALRTDPAQRWQSARAMRAAAREAARDTKAAQQPPRQARWPIALGVAGLLAGVAIALQQRPLEPDRVTVELRALPTAAELYLDGKRLPTNPYIGPLDADGRDHELRVSSPGFAPKARVFTARRDLEIELVLDPIQQPR